MSEQTTTDLQEEIVNINRVAVVQKGGRRFSFSALAVVGSGPQEGSHVAKIGYGQGKALEVSAAVRKALENARCNMHTIELNGDTIYHQIQAKYGSTTVFMMPAADGTGVIAGGAMRAVFNVAGLKNVLSKVIKGSTNPINVVKATIKALTSISTPEAIAEKRGKRVEDIWSASDGE